MNLYVKVEYIINVTPWLLYPYFYAVLKISHFILSVPYNSSYNSTLFENEINLYFNYSCVSIKI